MIKAKLIRQAPPLSLSLSLSLSLAPPTQYSIINHFQQDTHADKMIIPDSIRTHLRARNLRQLVATGCGWQLQHPESPCKFQFSKQNKQTNKNSLQYAYFTATEKQNKTTTKKPSPKPQEKPEKKYSFNNSNQTKSNFNKTNLNVFNNKVREKKMMVTNQIKKFK